jgi:hypothetical protein
VCVRVHARLRDTQPHTQLVAEDLAFFRSVLTDAGVETSADALEAHNVDWLRKYRGQATVALKPRTTAEVARVLRYCNERRSVAHTDTYTEREREREGERRTRTYTQRETHTHRERERERERERDRQTDINTGTRLG